MADVVKQCHEPKDLSGSAQGVLTKFWHFLKLGEKSVRVSQREQVKRLGRKFHNAERMLEPRMHGSRIQQVGHRELPDMSQALKHWMIHNLPFVHRIANKPMDRATDPLGWDIALRKKTNTSYHRRRKGELQELKRVDILSITNPQ